MRGVIAKKICEQQKHGVVRNLHSLKGRSMRGLKDFALEAFESCKAEGNGKVGNWFFTLTTSCSLQMKLSSRYRNYINREPQYPLSTLAYNSGKILLFEVWSYRAYFLETLQYFFRCVLDILQCLSCLRFKGIP